MGEGLCAGFFLFLAALIGHLRSDSCSEAEFERCLAVLQSTAQREDLALATTRKELALACRKLQKGVKCVDDHSSRCFNTAELRVYDSVVSESRQAIADLCIEGRMQEDYLRFAPCFRNISTDDTKCATKFKKMMVLSQAMDEKDKDTGLKLFCCALTDFSTCKYDHVEKDCAPGASQFLQKLTDRMSGSLINEHCVLYTFGSQSCSSTGIRLSPFSAQDNVVLIALLVSLSMTKG